VVDRQPDIIVVGGGSAGCAMAGRLAESGLKILLLEAGKTGSHIRLKVPALVSSVVQNPDFDWAYKAEPDPSIGGRADVWPGGKRLGGGSSINGMIYVRGHRHDYDNWVRMGAAGWSYDDCLPYFRRMERFEHGANPWRGDSGPIGVSDPRVHYPIVDAWVKAAADLGVPRTPDHNGEHPGEGTDHAQATQRFGLRSAAANYLKLPRAVPNLRVELESPVSRILFEGRRAVGVEVLRDGRRQELRARHGVVLSAGAMNSPRLLMLSGIGGGEELRAHGIEVLVDRPGVGGNLQEHVGVHVVNGVNTPTINSEAHGLAALRNGVDFLLRRRGILTASMAHGQTFLRTKADAPAPNLQISFTAFAFDLDAEGKLQMRRSPAVSTVVCLARPQSRGRLSLRSADPLAPPVIRHELLGVEDDVDQIMDGIRHVRRILDHPLMRGYITEDVRPDRAMEGEALRAYVHLAGFPLYHPVGTCRIGGEEDGVVDADLRLRGVEGLWVADASVMPTLPVGNTNATAIMIGDKGAAHVIASLGK